MEYSKKVAAFYRKHIPDAVVEGEMLRAPCPFCGVEKEDRLGGFHVQLSPESFFIGQFWCGNRCTLGGFPLYFARLMGLDPEEVPGFDPDREPYATDVFYPVKNIDSEIERFTSLMRDETYAYFNEFGVSRAVVDAMAIGYNGRYLVYPYFMENGKCYSARCVLPNHEEDSFWHGNKKFTRGEFRIFNAPEMERCEGGALFITEGENNLLTLKELHYPGIAVPSVADLENINEERLAYVNHIFLLFNHTPEAELAGRDIATRLGFKARVIKWHSSEKRDYSLRHLALDKGESFGDAVHSMIKGSRAFSPFTSPEREQRLFMDSLQRDTARSLIGVSSGFDKMDAALNGIRGLNIVGGPPKAGKSCFFIQISTEAAGRKSPVIYYDFENGRRKILLRTLSRLSRVPDDEIRSAFSNQRTVGALEEANSRLMELLPYFRVITDRKLNPDLMRRHIDFLQHETRSDHTLIVIDSLHKLPFKDLSDRRTGIDGWLRHLEAIRDEQNAAFLVVSELSRDKSGGYSERPDMGSFKESGDIEYSADNAMILLPDWDPLDPISDREREATLWLAASRESSPGKIATYALEYPYWGFRELP